ncbi:MAG: DUF2442 domain-containing protein [Candidatus Delongbacteria bacterium]|nr:DUF2442 domain-containing protein [Candidatus Delongbacteria bacterium]MCG2759841.1 DUF2442 domain-containing protein [Candidatus Delongbacteria bacterium]
MDYPKIKSVKAIPDYKLRVVFLSGDVKIYDCKPLFEKDAFYPLKNEGFFRTVKVDIGGYGIIWDDEIDLSESELWINGYVDISSVAEPGTEYKAK